MRRMPDQAPLPDTVAELRAMVLAQQASLLERRASIAKMVEELAARDDQIERLKAQIDKLRRMHFGRKSSNSRSRSTSSKCSWRT